MVFFPLAATVVSLVFSVLVLRQYLSRSKPYQLAWSVSLALFGFGALAETVATAAGWTELTVKIYYVLGATLVVGFLALGTLYVTGDHDAGSRTASLLLSRRFNLALSTVLTLALWSMIYGSRLFSESPAAGGLVVGLYLALIAAAVAVPDRIPVVYLVVLTAATFLGGLAVAGGQVDPAQLDQVQGWHALDRTVQIKTAAFSLNVIGSFIVIFGAVQSAVGLRRKRIMADRARANVLIAVGVLIVASGGTLGGLIGLGGQAALSVPMAVGVTVMFIGFLQASRPTPEIKPDPVPSPDGVKEPVA